MSKLWASLVVIAVLAAGVAFTSPGHRVLYRLGFATACGSDGGCD